jgi:adenosine deaminase
VGVRGFDDFIAQFTAMCALLETTEDFRRIAYEFCEDEARTGMRSSFADDDVKAEILADRRVLTDPDGA